MALLHIRRVWRTGMSLSSLDISFANRYCCSGTSHCMNNTWRQRRRQHDCMMNEKKAYLCHGERRRRINHCIERRAQCCIAVRESRKRRRTQGGRTKKMENTRERRTWEEKNTKTEEYSIGGIGIRHQHRRRTLALSIVICIHFSASASRMSRAWILASRQAKHWFEPSFAMFISVAIA